MKATILILIAGVFTSRVLAQSVSFDFNNARLYAPLPIDLTAGGITAHFTATGQGYSIQSSSTAPVSPWNGQFLYPSSIYASDLMISFSKALKDFSIHYSPQELACDNSATIRATAYWNGALVGSAETNATALCTCTWAVQQLTFSSTRPFNSVVIHWVAPGQGCQDYGPIFLANNLIVTPAPVVVLDQAARLPGGAFTIAFTNPPGGSFSVLASTNLTTWSLLGAPTEMSAGQYQFTDSQAANSPARFYRVSWP